MMSRAKFGADLFKTVAMHKEQKKQTQIVFLVKLYNHKFDNICT